MASYYEGVSPTTGGATAPKSWSELMAMANLPEIDREFAGAQEPVVRDIPGMGKLTFIPQNFGSQPWTVRSTGAGVGDTYTNYFNNNGQIGSNNLTAREDRGLLSELGEGVGSMVKTTAPIWMTALGANLAAGNLGSLGGAGGGAGAAGGDLAGLMAFEEAAATVPNLWGASAAAAPSIAEGANFFEGMTPAATTTSQGLEGLTQAAAPVVEKSFNANFADKIMNSSPGNIIDAVTSGASAAKAGGSIWDEIAKAVGITATAASGANSLKDVIGGLIGGYQSGETAKTYADSMKSAMDKYSETMKYAVDQSDPFREQRPQYQTQLADLVSGKTTSANNPNMIDTSTNNPYYMNPSMENNPYIMGMDQNNPNMMSMDRNNPFMMSTDKANNPWMADTDINGLLNSPMMSNLRDVTIDNTMRRLSSKYGGDSSSLGVVNEVAKQVNAANAPLAMDYYKSNLNNNLGYLNTATTNNTNYLNTASGNNQKYLGTAAANNQAYLGTAANNNQNLMKTAYGNNLDYMKTVGTAAGMNIQPQTGQVAQAGANGLAGIMQNYANNQVPLQNQTNGNYGYAANAGLDWLFKQFG